MDEGRRFIRYVVPGFVAGVLLLLHWIFADPTRLSRWDEIRKLEVLPLLGLVVATAAIGYPLSVLHHVLYGSIYSLLRFIPDFRPTLANAVRRGHLVLRVHQDDRPLTDHEIRSLSPRSAWLMLNCVWFDLLEPNLQPAEERSRSLFDIMHASGTLFVAWLVALAFWLVTESWTTTFIDTLKSHQLLLVFSPILASLFFFNYLWTAHLAEGFFSGMTATVLSRRIVAREIVVPRLPKWGRRRYP